MGRTEDQMTVAVRCPIHGAQAAPAATVRFGHRAEDKPNFLALAAPCPATQCPITVVLPPATREPLWVRRALEAGARIIRVVATTPATDLVVVDLAGGVA